MPTHVLTTLGVIRGVVATRWPTAAAYIGAKIIAAAR
jgi:hypothetical protein